MTAIATGVFKTVAFKRQTGLGVIATGGAATGQYIRRVKSTVDLQKSTFKSNEVLVSQQRRDFRHGIRSVTGTISGELSVGGYQPFVESICRQVVQAPVTTGAQTNISATGVGGGVTYTRAAGSFITDGFKLGDVVNATGWTTTGVANNNHYGVIINLAALTFSMSTFDGQSGATKVAGDSVTLATVGKKTFIPPSGQVKHYYTIEHWFGDIAQSEVFTDCIVSEMQLKMPATGLVTVDFPIMGLNMTESGTQYFTSPTASAAGGIEASVNGIIIINGTTSTIVTSAEITVKGGYSAVGGIVGQQVDPDIVPGIVEVTGQLTVLFTDTIVSDLFENESEFSLLIMLTSTANGATAAAPGFTALAMQRCKAGGMSKDDGEKQISITFPFTALENFSGIPGQTQTTLSIQDSAFA